MLAVPAAHAFDFSELENSVVEHTLDNGLTIIVLPRHDAPVVSFVTYADVGSVNDPKGYTGMAHMFEHMAFKGTPDIGTTNYEKELELMRVEDSIFALLRRERLKGPLADQEKIAQLEQDFQDAIDAAYDLVVPNDFSETMGQEGAVGLNAGTSYDMTMYYFSLPSNKVELWMAMESERFYKPVLREMYKERQVVAEERRMRTESSPFGRLMEEFFALAYKAHPYGVSIIGHMSDIQNYDRDAAMKYFEDNYSPANLTCVLVGDVKPKEVFKLAEKWWGRIPYRPEPEPINTVEPEQIGERRMVLEDPAQPIYWCGWHIPAGTHPDRPAIDAMMDYLGQGRTSLLYKNLVKDKKMAMEVQAFAGWPGNKYPTMANILCIPAQGHDNYECEQEIFTEVDKLKEQLLTQEELNGIKARARSSFINGLVSNSGLASQMAVYNGIYGDWREMFRELDRINAVTAEDVQRVANEYFTEKNRVVVMMNTIEEESEEGVS
ncbi:insulinase family protein [candidate division GN15 bacterium]|nr:insulinase family protein [candidate division GN15 bacterium]